jgi:hypothetical protein
VSFRLPRHQLGTRTAVSRSKKEAEAAADACRNQFSEDAKVAVARADCLNKAEALMLPVVTYPDLLNLKMAKRAELAAKVQSGALQRTDAQLQFSEFITHLVDEEQQRSLASRSVAAQELSAYAANAPRTCTSYGNTVSCF